MKLLTAGVAARFWFASSNDRRDVQSEALLFALERIDRFKPAKGNNAFAYYTTLIFNRILKEMNRLITHRQRFVCASQM